MAHLIAGSKNYRDLLASLKTQIRTAQVRAAVAVNNELVVLYWGIGQAILSRQKEDGWGTKVIERLAKDLRSEFPEMQGLSPRNLGYMRAFAVAWPEEAILQQAAAKLLWFHNCVLLDKIKHPEERLWYMQQAFHSGWNRSVFTLRATDSGEISTTLHRRNDFPHNLAGISLDAVLPKPEDRPSVHSQ